MIVECLVSPGWNSQSTWKEQRRFNAKCANKLCQFRHSKNKEPTKDDNDDKTTRKENVVVEPADRSIDESSEDDNDDSGVESCDFCGQEYDDIDDLIDHYGITGHNLPESEHNWKLAQKMRASDMYLACFLKTTLDKSLLLDT